MVRLAAFVGSLERAGTDALFPAPDGGPVSIIDRDPSHRTRILRVIGTNLALDSDAPPLHDLAGFLVPHIERFQKLSIRDIIHCPVLPSVPGIHEIHKLLIFLEILPGRQQFLTLWTARAGASNECVMRLGHEQRFRLPSRTEPLC